MQQSTPLLPYSQDMDIGGYHVPKGTAVLTAQYSFHHNPEYWQEPEKFQPERCASGCVPSCFSSSPHKAWRRCGQLRHWLTKPVSRLDFALGTHVLLSGQVTHLAPSETLLR